MGLLTTQVAAAAGAAFWPNPVGKAVIETSSPGAGPGELAMDSGIILAPTASQWSMFPWRLDMVASSQNQMLGARVYAGLVLFSDIAGTPDVRFGTGTGDPGRQVNSSPTKLQGFNYNLANDAGVDLLMDNTPSRPIEIFATGEIRLWVSYLQHPAYVKGVLTVGPEVILPFNPFLVP